MSVATISGKVAWETSARSSTARWESAAERLSRSDNRIAHAPKFRLSDRERFFCLGSCFARNIEEHLIYAGAMVLSKRIVSPRAECTMRPNAIVNKFTTQSILQELRWLNEPPPDPQLYLLESSTGWKDLQLSPQLVDVTLERASARRAYLQQEYFPRVRSASIVILTLGLNEVWYDAEQETYLNGPPSLWATRRQPNRFEVRIESVDENVACLDAIYRLLSQLAPGVRLIVTVSPVPMNATFSGRDVLVANSTSKSVLRSAAAAFCERCYAADYFPSFEMVSCLDSGEAFAPDRLHVRDDVVRSVVDQFFEAYLPSRSSEEIGFSELAYFEANPDVEDQVRLGRLESAFEHWTTLGRTEGRRTRPDEATGRMRVIGQ